MRQRKKYIKYNRIKQNEQKRKCETNNKMNRIKQILHLKL